MTIVFVARPGKDSDSDVALAERQEVDAGVFIGALCSGDSRHAEARVIVEAARRGELNACTSVGVLSEVYAALTWVGAQPPQTRLSSGALRSCIGGKSFKNSSFRY